MSITISRPRSSPLTLTAATLLLATACSRGDRPQSADTANPSPLSASSSAPSAASTAESPASAASGADAEAEAERFTLTMPVVEKSMQALTNLVVAGKRHPEAESVITASLDMGHYKSWKQMAAAIDSQPIARQAVQAAGLSTREYALTNWVSFQAGLARSMVDAGMDVNSVAKSSHVSSNNITFMQQHGDDVRRLQAAAVAKAQAS